jgi:hypothetical protein
MFGVPRNSMMGKEEEEDLLENTDRDTFPQPPKRSQQQLLPLFLIISVTFNIFLGFFGLFNLTHERLSSGQGSYEHGFASDLGMQRRYQHHF